MDRAFYAASLEKFCTSRKEDVVNHLKAQAADQSYPPTDAQIYAWDWEVGYLQDVLRPWSGKVFFEYSIPRMGRRIDVVALIGPAVLVIEFKVGESDFNRDAVDQVWDYALDLKNFHEGSHVPPVIPVLIVTEGKASVKVAPVYSTESSLFNPRLASPSGFPVFLGEMLAHLDGPEIDAKEWINARYLPTPTIIEAAVALYSRHSVTEISRSEAGGVDLGLTSRSLDEVVVEAQKKGRKAICFVTGVPGSGKTLIGLNAATRHLRMSDKLYSVFLSGNGPLVKVLCEALARDQVRSLKETGVRARIGESRTKVKAFIQNVHHFRDECLRDPRPPPEHVAIFDEAQRAWDVDQTSHFMQRRKHLKGFRMSEPEYLIQCLDRHPDWAVIICLVGGGQEINTGEAGIGEWIRSLDKSFPDWEIHISPHLRDSEYSVDGALDALENRGRVVLQPGLHLSTSLRSFRAENISTFVKQVLDLDVPGAQDSLAAASNFPMVLTRSLPVAKEWVRENARGSERYGIVVSSQAERLKPHAISIHSPVDPIHWFLDPKEDVRSSYYLEDVATEFHIQGLELDWTCVTWDADLRLGKNGWEHWSFRGDGWQRIRQPSRQRYLKNAYRVLLTRARQGMVIVVPEGTPDDPTRLPTFYDPTYDYLRQIGLPVI